MSVNVTLRMDEKLLTRLRHKAVDARMSFSAWAVSVLQKTLENQEEKRVGRKAALARLRTGFSLGGKPLTRNESHAR
jgi:hypothetical protein